MLAELVIGKHSYSISTDCYFGAQVNQSVFLDLSQLPNRGRSCTMGRFRVGSTLETSLRAMPVKVESREELYFTASGAKEDVLLLQCYQLLFP